MTWTGQDTANVKRSMLGSWPGTIVAWGADAIDAYLYVLQARGLDAEQVLTAIGSWPEGSDFPPSAPNLAAAALRDPAQPTFDEALMLICRALKAGRGSLRGDFSTEAQMIAAREEMVRASAREMHPLVESFVARCSDLSRLGDEVAELAGGDYAGARRRDLQQRWEAHVEAMEGRDVASIAAGRRRGELGRLDPLAALDVKVTPRVLGSGLGA